MFIHNSQLVVSNSQLFVIKLRIANGELPIVNDVKLFFKKVNGISF